MTSLNDFNRKFVETRMTGEAKSNGPAVWVRDFLKQFYTVDASGRAFISNSISIESLILKQAAQFEIHSFGRVSEDVGQLIAHFSATDFDCDALARSLLFESAESGWSFPKSLLPNAKDIVAGKKNPEKQGSRYWKIRTRNQVGAMALLVLTDPEGFGLDATRNPATNDRLCGCDLLANATAGRGWASITHAAATEIWRNRTRLIAEFHCNYVLTGASQLGRRIDPEQAFQLLGALLLYPMASGRKAKI